MKTKPRVRVFGKDSRDGFTLVELIVVLVILAILAAFLIPSLTGYIDKARQKQIIVQTRQAVMAAQTLFDEAYASGSSTAPCEDVLSLVIGKNGNGENITISDQILKLADLDPEKGCIDDGSVATNDIGKISTLTWRQYSKDGKSDLICKYDASKNEPYTIE